jgi:adenine-specific DNA-methyltransferase
MAHERIKPEFLFDEEKIKQLKQIAPECFEDGKLNFETLRQNLGDWVQEDEDGELEHFGLFWPGKKDARRIAATPPEGTLEPVYGEGLKADGTPDDDGVNDSKNIFIEGENLEVLKILQKSYANKIKMIYIDPPYNTGKDFVYDDVFTETLNDYLKRTGQVDEEGRALTTNKKSDGRFHSKWLSMMYPRLRLARNLLKEDGVIFVSIGDNEIQNLKNLLNEIFGEENFVGNFIWNTDGHTDNQLEVKTNHEYILCYQKDSTSRSLNNVIDPNTRAESNLHKGFAENSITKNGPKNPPSKIVLKKGFPCIVNSLDLPKSKVANDFFEEVKSTGHINREITKKYNATYPVRLDDIKVRNGKLTEDVEVFAGWANANKLKAFIQNNFEELVEEDGEITFYLSSKGVVYYRKERESAKNILSVLRGFMTTEKMRSELEKNEIYFSYPKPVDLLEYLISMGLKENEILLDFFAGSGSTGHAFYNYIKTNNTLANYILVQMSEPCNVESLAYQKGFKTIPEITRKRLKHYSKDSHLQNQSFGFKYYKWLSSNFKSWEDFQGKEISQLETSLDLFNNSPLREDWNKNKLLTELMLLEGFPLGAMQTKSQIGTNEIMKIESEMVPNTLLICLDDEIEESLIDQLELDNTSTFICLDSAISNQNKLRLSDKGLIKTI